MKLLIQRSPPAGLSWVALTLCDGKQFAEAQVLAQGDANYTEPKFSPRGDIYWLRNGRICRMGRGTPLTGRDIVRFAFDSGVSPVTVELKAGKTVLGRCGGQEIAQVVGSVTGIQSIPGGPEWLVCSAAGLFRGELTRLSCVDSDRVDHIAVGPGAYYFLKKKNLFRQLYSGGQTELVYRMANGRAKRILHTEQGIFLSQVSPSRVWLINPGDGTDRLVWHGMGESLEVCSARSQSGSI